MKCRTHSIGGMTVLGLLQAMACTGQIVDGSDRLPGTDPGQADEPHRAGESPPNPGSSGPGVPPPDVSLRPGVRPIDLTGAPGPRPLRRLTRVELANTLTDLLGVRASVPAGMPDDVLGGSGYLEGGNISRLEAEVMMEWAAGLAIATTEAALRVATCAAAPADLAEQNRCAQLFISQFGRRAFRRPLLQAEGDELFAFYGDKLRATLGHEHPTAIRALVQLMLQSPRFLYHWERAPGPAVLEAGRVRLGSHEVASRLSYLLWGSMPDETLFAAADRGELGMPAQVSAQARRMLANPKASHLAESFTLQWLGIGDISRKNKAARYAFTPELGRAMLAETRRFATRIFAEDGSLETLLTSSITSVDDARLAKLYGHAGAVSSSAPTAVTLDPTRRAGLLTHASFLTAQSLGSELNPIKRGLAIAEQLLCLHIPSPPPDVPSPRAVDPNLSTRQRLTEHANNECARGCHGIFDPFGLAFEHYDGIGAYRTLDGAKPVDASVAVRFPSGETRMFKDAVELTWALAQSPDVRKCVARQWMRYALRRHEVPADEPSLRVAEETLLSPPHDFRQLVVALTTTPAFLFRSPSTGEASK